MRRLFYTNQQHLLIRVLAEAGVTDEMLLASSEGRPIILTALDIDVTERQGLPVVFFCRSRWSAAGLRSRRLEGDHEELSHHPLVRISGDMPDVDTRYGCAANLWFNRTAETAELWITAFERPSSIPYGTNVCLDSCKFVEHEVSAPADANVDQPEMACA